MKLEFDPRLLTDIIGKGQYTQFRSVLAEYVANAWDAEAKSVQIITPEDFTQDPVVILDDGSGIRDLNAFRRVGYNVQTDNVYTREYRRSIMGNKGIGRFAGFSLAHRITYETNNGENKIKIVFDRSELLRHDSVAEVDVPTQIERSESTVTWTKVTLDMLDQQYTIPSDTQIMRDLLTDFGSISDFSIILNSEKCEVDDIRGEVIEIDETDQLFGHVSGNIRVSLKRSKKLSPGVVIRVKNRRVVGPSFFGIEDGNSSKITNRIYGDVNADDLEDIVSSGREAFIQHDERYVALTEFVRRKLKETVAKMNEVVEENIEETIYNLPRFKKRFSQMPSHLQNVSRNYIKRIAPRLARIRNDRPLLEVIAMLVLRASENADYYVVLDELERTEATDVSTLAKVLRHWGFGEIAHASLLIQNRIKVLSRFAEMVHNKETLELQGIHRALESNPWILEDRYSLFTSNQSLKTVLNKLGEKYSGMKGRNRPDLILKRDRDDFLLIELKAPSVEISMTEVSQALAYRTEIRNSFPGARDMDVYLIGKRFDQTSQETFKPGNTQQVHLMSLDDILQDAEDRLRWLSEHIKQEYEELQSEYEATDVLSEISAR